MMINEVAQKLQELSETVPVPLELPDEDDLVVIEEEILLSLPRDLKDFLLEVSDVVYGALEPVTVADPNSHTHLPDVTAEAWASGLPRDLIPICLARGGYYCVTQKGIVVYWADGEQAEQEWESIWFWAEAVWIGQSEQ